jgi:spore coat polysaccharide biosynthesis protein SpsF
MEKKVIGIVQARMSSQRLPGKVLRKAAGRPLLDFIADVMNHTRNLDSWLIATSRDSSDDAIEAYCKERNISCVRGDLKNVSARFAEALKQMPAQAFVRINADSPLHDPYLIDQCVEIFKNGQFDLVSNVFPRTFPKGRSVEVIRAKTFLEALPMMKEPDFFEHVTKLFYVQPESYQIYNVHAERDYQDINLCVDREDDWRRFEEILKRMKKPAYEHNLQEIAGLYWEVCKN